MWMNAAFRVLPKNPFWCRLVCLPGWGFKLWPAVWRSASDPLCYTNFNCHKKRLRKIFPGLLDERSVPLFHMGFGQQLLSLDVCWTEKNVFLCSLFSSITYSRQMLLLLKWCHICHSHRATGLIFSRCSWYLNASAYLHL